MFKMIFISLLISTQAIACKYEVCENRCENKFLAQGGVPLWTCAENCATCQG